MLRGRVALVLEVVAILAAVLLIYWQDLEVVATDALNSEVMNYILIIPFLMGFALYRKRRMLQAVFPIENPKEVRRAETVAGVSLCVSAFVLYWLGSYTFYPVEYHLLSMPVFLAGAALLVYNWQTLRQLVFPLALLLFLEPLPLDLANMIGFQMSALSSIAAYSLVKLLGLPVVLVTQQTPIIVTQTVQGSQLPLAIDVACSGLYSLTGFVAFAAFAGFIMRGAAWKRAALLSVGFPMIYGLNILRIATIVWIGHGWGEGAAVNAFHLLGGSVLIFIATLLLLTIGDKMGKLRIFASRAGEEPCPICKDSVEKGESFCPYCGTFLESQERNITTGGAARATGVVVIAFLLALIQIPPFALAKGTAEIDLDSFSARELKNVILPTVPGWDLEFVNRDTVVERWMEWDAALAYSYQKQGSEEPQPAVFVLIEIMKGRHSWEASLYALPAERGQPTATMIEQRDLTILAEPRITGRFLEFIRVGSTTREVVVYWFERALFTANDTQVSRYVSISLDVYPEDLARAGLIGGTNDREGIEALLLPLAERIAEHWQPLKTWASIGIGLTAGLGELGGYILILTISPCAVVVASFCLKMRRRKERNTEVYRGLMLLRDRKVLEALASTSKEKPPTGRHVEAKYCEITGEDADPKALIATLKEATETGLVDKETMSWEDQPLLVWKRRF